MLSVLFSFCLDKDAFTTGTLAKGGSGKVHCGFAMLDLLTSLPPLVCLIQSYIKALAMHPIKIAPLAAHWFSLASMYVYIASLG